MAREVVVKAGQIWQRERDGMIAVIEVAPSYPNGQDKWRPVDGGRLRWNWEYEITTGWDLCSEGSKS